MRSLRTMETTMLGYPIERAEERDDLGVTISAQFEVLCPRTGSVLGSFAARKEAEWFVLLREMRDIHERTRASMRNLAA